MIPSAVEIQDSVQLSCRGLQSFSFFCGQSHLDESPLISKSAHQQPRPSHLWESRCGYVRCSQEHCPTAGMVFLVGDHAPDLLCQALCCLSFGCKACFLCAFQGVCEGGSDGPGYQRLSERMGHRSGPCRTNQMIKQKSNTVVSMNSDAACVTEFPICSIFHV